jgi:hypothetical protein
MRSLLLAVFAAWTTSLLAVAQGLSPDDQRIVDSARSRYYSLDKRGFQSVTCTVSFDFSTAPILPSDNPKDNLQVLESTQFVMTLDRNGPTVLFRYPEGAGDAAQRQADPTANLLKSLIQGLFLTWPTKGLNGPIPPFDSQIKTVTKTDDGYRLTLSFPGDPVRIEMDKDLLVNEIVSVGGKVDERPKYSPTPEGLIFVGNHAIDNEDSGRVEVMYELESSTIEGMTLPSAAHLVVNSNLNVRFRMDECSVTKGTVLSVLPPKHAEPAKK